jgi:outer membrane protein OmpA-like peptidoglycan-associated protein
MMKKYLIILATCLLIPALIHAQSLYKAQKLMDKYDYSQAIEILKKAIAKEKTRDEALPMLAECYRLQHDILNTKSTYAQVVALPEVKPEAFYYYAKALQGTGNYTKAREMFQKYAEKNPSDPKGSLYVSHCDSILGSWKGRTPEFEARIANNINTVQSDFGPVFYEGDLIFTSDYIKNPGEGKPYGWTGNGYLNIMKSEPEKAGDFWGSMGKATEFDSKFNQKYHDGPASFSDDGNSIYFTRAFRDKAKRNGIYKTELLKIFYATKNNGVWGEVKPFYLNSTTYSVGHPSISGDGKTLYFVSDMPGGQGGTDIWMCNLANDKMGPAVNLGPTVNTSENEMFPTIRDNGVLYFASDGHPGYGALDIFKTRNENGSWTTPENLYPPINSSFDDFAIAFLPGEKSGFFSSNRPEGVGNDDIYAFRIPEPPALISYISGAVKDKTNMQPIAGATVFVYNTATGNVKVLKTGADGMYRTLIDKPEEYIVKSMAPGYIADCTPFPKASMIPGTTSLAPRDLLLDKLVVNKTFRIENIYYNFDKYNIRKDAMPELDKLVTIMNENEIVVELGSHTDSRGSFEYNDKLSQRRAESVVKYIVGAGIDKNRITAKGYGERQLVNKCADGVPCTPEEQQANRRTEFKITSLIVPVANPDQFDPNIYFEGQDLFSKMLPPDFFNRCK